MFQVHPHRHLRLAALLLAMLLAAACGEAGTTTTAATTTAPATTAGGTTTTAETSTSDGGATTTTGPAGTTTTAGSPGPLGPFLDSRVSDPFHETGFHPMRYADDSQDYLVSRDRLTGSQRLALAVLDLVPPPAGLAPDQRLVMVWADGYDGPGMAPFAVALYRLGGSGWAPDVVIRTSELLAFLETTTDYQAKQPDGTAILHMNLKSFEWNGFARIVSGVTVYDDAAATHVVYEGEVECTYSDPGGCILLSDDGVLRPGDTGDAVQAFEQDLAAIGYFPQTPNTVYDATTEAAVKVFQRDYRLAVDGKAGPQTIALADDIHSGNSDIVMAHQEGIQGVSFGELVGSALPQLTGLLGPPDYTVGWQVGPCGTWQWYKVTWGGFNAIFTERDGPRQFDGWEVTDLATVPANLYFVGGIAPSWTWSNFAAMGAQYDPDYQFWYHAGFNYRMGTFVNHPPSNPPANGAKVQGFGTGTGGILYDC